MLMIRAGLLIGIALIGPSVWGQPSFRQPSTRPASVLIRFPGSVARGARFEHPIQQNMLFRLDPTSEGWHLAIVIKKIPEDEHREACEPLHGGSACDFAGEYFTANSTAWPYLKSRVRQFGVGLGRQRPVSDQEKQDNPDWWRTPDYERRGMGRFIIEDIKVDAAPGDEHPGILSMRFRVELRLPR